MDLDRRVTAAPGVFSHRTRSPSSTGASVCPLMVLENAGEGPGGSPRTKPSLKTRRLRLRKNNVRNYKGAEKCLTQFGHRFKTQGDEQVELGPDGPRPAGRQRAAANNAAPVFRARHPG
jgi:hypothetical protein